MFEVDTDVKFVSLIFTVKEIASKQREPESHDVNSKATESTEYIFKKEACVSTLDQGRNWSKIFRAAATDAQDMDDDKVANLETIIWNVSALTVRWHHV